MKTSIACTDFYDDLSNPRLARAIFRSGLAALSTVWIVACGGGGTVAVETQSPPSTPTVSAPADTTPTINLDPSAKSGVLDSFGESLSNSQWQSLTGDAAGGSGGAAADGTAAEGAAMANATVSFTDIKGKTVSAQTDANGYYRANLTGLTAPMVVSARLGERIRYSLIARQPELRKFTTINITGLTEKIASDVSIASGGTSAAVLTPAMIEAKPAAVASSTANLRSQLTTQLAANSLSVANFDPITQAFRANHTGHDALLDTTLVTRSSSGATEIFPDAKVYTPGIDTLSIDQFISDFNRLNKTTVLQTSTAFSALHDDALLDLGRTKTVYLTQYKERPSYTGADIVNPKISNCVASNGSAAAPTPTYIATCDMVFDYRLRDGNLVKLRTTQLRQYSKGWLFAGDRMPVDNAFHNQMIQSVDYAYTGTIPNGSFITKTVTTTVFYRFYVEKTALSQSAKLEYFGTAAAPAASPVLLAKVNSTKTSCYSPQNPSQLPSTLLAAEDDDPNNCEGYFPKSDAQMAALNSDFATGQQIMLKYTFYSGANYTGTSSVTIKPLKSKMVRSTDSVGAQININASGTQLSFTPGLDWVEKVMYAIVGGNGRSTLTSAFWGNGDEINALGGKLSFADIVRKDSFSCSTCANATKPQIEFVQFAGINGVDQVFNLTVNYPYSYK